MILRKYIHQRLSLYYQQPKNAVVGALLQSDHISFKKILGHWHWQRIFDTLYKKKTGQWLTPVELFNPHYSKVIANFIAKEARNIDCGGAIEVVEFGGGRGTNAKCILDHLQEKHNEVYRNIKYTIMDSSPTLLELQRDVLLSGENNHKSKVNLEKVDVVDIAEGSSNFLKKSKDKTILVAMEVLDNLPHDKVTTCRQTGVPLQANLIEDKESGELQEKFAPLKDQLLKNLIDTYPSYLPPTGYRWVPTIGAQMLKRLFERRPNSSVVLADFDYLPPPDIMSTASQRRITKRADGEPLVTDMKDKDHECYLNTSELCDILFPTDFELLQQYVLKILPSNAYRSVEVMKQKDFLQEYGKNQIKETTSWTGYSPLIEDFSNCSVLTVSNYKVD